MKKLFGLVINLILLGVYTQVCLGSVLWEDQFNDNAIDGIYWNTGGITWGPVANYNILESNGLLSLNAAVQTSINDYGAAAWAVTDYNFNSGFHKAVFRWRYSVQSCSLNYGIIEITDGSMDIQTGGLYDNNVHTETAGRHFLYKELLFDTGNTEFQTWSICFDTNSKYAYIYNNPDCTGTPVSYDNLSDINQWHIRFLVCTAISAGIPANNVKIELDWISVTETQDPDGDGIQSSEDNCPFNYNPGQEDADNDGRGDLCDNCRVNYNPNQEDSDNDTLGDVCDNCPFNYNPDQRDSDSDDFADACDPCPYDADNDFDNDAICGDIDNCPYKPNSPSTGTCVKAYSGLVIGTGVACTDNSNCDYGETCQMNQGDINVNGIGDVCECYADLNGDRGVDSNVNVFDLIIIKNEYNRNDCDVSPCQADINDDGNVNIFDLIILKNEYGRSDCPGIDYDLAAYYPFNGNADDASGNGNSGTVNGAVPTTDRDANTNSAYSFNGINDYIEVSHSGDIDFSDEDFTISMWFRTNDESQRYMISKNYGASSKFWGIISYGPSNPETSERTQGVTALINDGTNSSSVHVNINYVDDNWHHVTFVRNRTADQLLLYIDGILESAEIDNCGSLSNTAPLLIGNFGTPGYNYDGSIDNIHIYKRALSKPEVIKLFYK